MIGAFTFYLLQTLYASILFDIYYDSGSATDRLK